MSEDIYYYRDQCQALESELAQAKKTIAKLERRLYDIQVALRSRTVQNSNGVLETVAWIVYDWNKKYE